MFAEERWARAFISVCGANAEEGSAALNAISDCVLAIRGRVAGVSAARRLESVLNLAREKAGAEASGGAVEIACRVTVLLTRKGFLRHLPRLLVAVEKIRNAENGIRTAVVESAFPLDHDYLAELGEKIKRETGCREVRVSVRITPEILGGCRLMLDGELWDASLAGQLQKMAADLHAAGGAAW
jgi:F0F1-type ATP synthase delta subunit